MMNLNNKILMLLVGFFLTINVLAQENSIQSDSTLVNDPVKSFYIDDQLEIFRAIPSNLYLWEKGDFSLICFNAQKENGDFKTVDQFTDNESLIFSTESVQTIKKSAWRFYGNFTYQTSRHEDANWNMYFKQSDVGNPFKILIQHLGDFNVKQYHLSGIINKKVNNKLFLGFGVNYFGDLYFRIRDTRNEFYNLTTEFSGALTYQLKENRHISLSLAYLYKKSSPKFSNEFKTNGEEYYLYMNEGLGDFNNDIDISDRMYFKDSNPKFSLGYFSGNKNKFSLQYSFYPGKEEWEYRITSMLTETKAVINKYEYINNNLTSSYQVNKYNYELFNLLKASYISGTGYKNRTLVFQKSYVYDATNLSFKSKLRRKDKQLFYLSSINLSFRNVSKKDMVYGQKITYSNCKIDLQSGCMFNLQKDNSLLIDILGAYNSNLSYTHDVVAAASKPYTTNVAYNEVSYNTANYYKIGTQVKWHKKIKSYVGELYFKYNYIKPTDIKINNQYSILTTNDKRSFIEAGINVYF